MPDGTDPGAGEIQATPLARSLAEHLDIDLESLEIEGGQITEHDVRAAAETRAAKARLVPVAKTRLGQETVIVQPGSMAASAVLSDAPDSSDPEPASIDRIVCAVALALRRHSALNSRLVQDELLTFDVVNVALSGATEGVGTVVIGGVEVMDAPQIAVERRRFENIAATRGLRSWDMPEGTFPVSYVGSPIIASYAPPLRPPYVAVLGVRLSRASAPEADPRSTVEFSLSYDGRAIDDRDAAGFLALVIELLEGATPGAFDR